MTVKIAKYLSFNCTQGGADAFKETAIATELDPANGYAFQIIGIDFAFTTACNWSTIAATSEISIALSRDTKAAVPELSDPDCMLKIQRAFMFAGAAFCGELGEGAWHFTPSEGIYIVEPTIYAELDSTATAKTLVLNGRIYYEEVKLTEVEILRLLNNI